MASDIFNVQPPAWYQAIARPPDSRRYGQLIGTALGGGLIAATEGKSFGEGVADARMNQADPTWKAKWQLEKDAMDIRKADAIARAESYHWLAEDRKNKALDWQNDISTGVLDAARKLASGDELTPEDNMKLAGAKSERAVAAIQTAETIATRRKAVENNSLTARLAVKDTEDFIDRIGKVDPASRAEIKGMAPNKDGTPSKQQWAALGFAEETQRQKSENERAMAELEAQKRGDLVTTTITGDKVTQRYAPKPPEKPTEEFVRPTLVDMGDGRKMWFYKDFKPWDAAKMGDREKQLLNILNFQMKDLIKQRNTWSPDMPEYGEFDKKIAELQKQVDSMFEPQEIDPKDPLNLF